MIGFASPLIGFESTAPINYPYHVRQFMASASKKSKKSGADKPRISATQRKLRRQQVGMAIFAMILVIAMILSLVVR
jgi:hypothetical protein